MQGGGLPCRVVGAHPWWSGLPFKVVGNHARWLALIHDGRVCHVKWQATIPSTKEHEIEEVEGTWYRSCLDKWMRWSLEICRRAPSLDAPCSERRHLGVFIVAWLEQQVRCVVIEKGILHVSQALFRPRDEGLPPIGTDFLVGLLVAQGVSRSITKW
ncbi:unnamed protein product [Prunus armeniaca]|uniref:Uncharacterized protein n=1 Tax=Prunus armeniaca TaxID=36596 RepID=A0A6J5XC25_PRUAR|nr:unnamed protein product [Prunus armeniaca]